MKIICKSKRRKNSIKDQKCILDIVQRKPTVKYAPILDCFLFKKIGGGGGLAWT